MTRLGALFNTIFVNLEQGPRFALSYTSKHQFNGTLLHADMCEVVVTPSSLFRSLALCRRSQVLGEGVIGQLGTHHWSGGWNILKVGQADVDASNVKLCLGKDDRLKYGSQAITKQRGPFIFRGHCTREKQFTITQRLLLAARNRGCPTLAARSVLSGTDCETNRHGV
jgi:hypothetical protein